MIARHTTEEIGQIVHTLRSGGVALLPTDTVYGLAAIPGSRQAVDRIFSLKGRPQRLNLPIMISSRSEIEALGLAITESAARLLSSPLVPGALTIALGFAGPPKTTWLEGRDEVAIRIPNYRLLLDILERSGPLLVTSANAHGEETGEAVTDILPRLQGKPDAIVDGGILSRVASTLVNCRREPPVIEREGAIGTGEVMKYLGQTGA